MNAQRLKYFLSSALRLGTGASCPACGSDTHHIKRKAIVTSLRECPSCGLRFRFPKPSSSSLSKFYQSQYIQGETTRLPSDDELERLKSEGFANMECDYASYIRLLKKYNVGPVLLDFGCSWGYGSWLFGQSGYEVYSYEISQPRATYAREKLACRILTNPLDVPEKVDCFFSAHVIEHLADPCTLWEIASKTLKPNGVVVLFMPNGDKTREHLSSYHSHWGQVHPLYLNPTALNWQARKYGFTGTAYSSPYVDGDLSGEELMYVASLGRELFTRA